MSNHRGTVLAALVLTMLAPLGARAQCTVTTLADTGTGSLRACITANNGQTITFDPSLVGGTITVLTPLPTLIGGTVIGGPGPNLLTVSGGNAVRIFDIIGAGVSISGLTIANGNSSGPGGGILNDGTLTVSNCTFSGNYSASNGGGIFNYNHVSVSNSTFSGNSAGEGGGIFTLGTLTLSNSTFFGNTASTLGGGILADLPPSSTISNTTLSGNTAEYGGGIFIYGDVILSNDIVAGNTSTQNPGVDCDGNCGTQANNLIGGNPQLSPLGWYGGATQTMLPLPGSPAIGAGMATATDAPTTDQRGFARPSMTGSTVDVGAVQTNYLLVTTTADVSDSPSGCSSTGGAPCSLRDALGLAASGGTDIAFAPGVIGVITLTTPLPAITGNLDLVGPGANLLTISGGGSSAVGAIFNLSSSNAALSGITIANGNNGARGGGISNAGTLTLSNSALSGNVARVIGGGIYNGGTLTVYNSTFSGNNAGSDGGGIDSDGIAIVNYSTFTGNSAHGAGGGIYSSGISAVNNSTFSGNASGPNNGGGIDNFEGTLTANNSILTGDSGGECAGTGCPSNGVNGNVVDATPAQPILSPLGWYGGPTQTMLPLPGSLAICAGSVSLDPSGFTTDQRGFPRTNLASNCLDAGAAQTNYLIVTTTTDVVDVSPAAACDASADAPCSLRDALTLAARNGSADIAFAANVNGTIDLSTVNMPAPSITGNLDLFGPGAGNITVSGGGSGSVGSIFNMNSPNAALSGITVFNGNSGNGGGLYNSGALTVSDSIFSNNGAQYNGGGIYNNSGALMVNGSTFSAGFTQYGGGIFNSGGILKLTGSTLFNNNAGEGGGIFSQSTMVMNNSTVSGNQTAFGGGIFNNGSPLTLSNSIVAGNTAMGDPGDDCDGCGTQSSSNFISTPGSIVDPMLASLGSYGGPTPTMLPLPGSPAICAGSAALDPGSLTTDQRGFPRLNTTYTGFSASTPCLDLGAVQTNYQSVQFAQPSYSGTPGVAVSTPAAPVVSVTENGQNIGGVPVTLSFMGTQPNSSSGLGPQTTNAGTGATFSALRASPAGYYTLLASLTIVGMDSISGTAALDIATPATVTSLSSANANGTYTTTAQISITVNFSKAVNVTGVPKLALNSGGTASYSSGSGGSVLVFTYTVASPQSTSALDESSRTALTLNGGTIDSAGNIPATLTLPMPGATGSLSANTTIVINTTQYRLTIAASPAAAGTVQASPTSTLNVTPTLPTGTYLKGSMVQLIATPANAGFSFSDWTGTTPTSPSNPLSITMNSSVSETAHFTANDVSVTINTSPQGLMVSVDHGTPAAAPVSVNWRIDSNHTIATTTPQSYNNISYAFAGWSDMGAISHQVTAMADTTSYTASFATPPTIAKSFLPTRILTGGTSTLSFTINNPNASQSISGIAFTDTFPIGMQVFGAPDVTNTCGGTFTPVAAATVIQLSGASLSAGGSCGLSVKVKATQSGPLNNTTGPIRSTPGGTGATSNQATLTVDTPTTVTSLTSAASGTYTTRAQINIAVNFSNPVTVTGFPRLALNSGGTAIYSTGSGTSSLTFIYTVASPQSTSALDASSTAALTLSGGTIQDGNSFPANLTLPTPGATGSLSANTTIVINTTQYKLTTSVLPAGAGSVKANPTSTLNVTPPLTAGTYLSGSMVQITATPANAGYSFSNWTGTEPTSTSNPLSIMMNGPVTETANFTANDVSVTINTSPQGLMVSVDHGTPAAAPVAVNWRIDSNHTIATTTPQSYNNMSYAFTGWSDMGAISHQVTAMAGTTSYTASFATPPTIAKSFSPTTIVEGGSSTLSFTINNPNASQSLSGIAFTDSFPTGLVVYGVPDATNTCGGTFTPVAGATVIQLSGASLAGGGSCGVSVTVKATQAGPLNNTTGPIRSTPGGAGATSNTATLTVNTPITLVQHASTDAGINSYASLAFGAPNTAGNWIAVVVRGGLSNDVFTVKDSLGNRYRQAIQRPLPGSPGGETLAIFYAESIAGGANTVTVFDTVADTLRFAILEYSGVAASNSLDRVASAQGSNATPASGVLTTTTNGDLLLAGILSVDPETFTAGAGYTAVEQVSAAPNTKLLVEQRIQPTAGPAEAGATLGGADSWGAVLAAFHPAPAVVTK